VANDCYYSGLKEDNMNESLSDQAIAPSSAYAQRWLFVSSTKMDENFGGRKQ